MAGRTVVDCGASVRLQQRQGSECDHRAYCYRDQRAADVLGLADHPHPDHQAEDDQHRQHQSDDAVPLPQLVERDEQASAEGDREDALADHPDASQERRTPRLGGFRLGDGDELAVLVAEVDVLRARLPSPTGQIVGHRLAAEQGVGARPQVGRPGRHLDAVRWDVERRGLDVVGGFRDVVDVEQAEVVVGILVVVDEGVRAHLLGATDRGGERGARGCLRTPGRRGEVQRLGVGVTLLEVRDVVCLGRQGFRRVLDGPICWSMWAWSLRGGSRNVDLGVASLGWANLGVASLGHLDVVGFLDVCGIRHDGDLAGQFGDGDRVTVAAPTAASAANRRGPDGPVLGQHLGDRDRSGAAVVVVWFCHRVSLALAKPADVSIKAVPSASLSSFRKISPSRNAQGQMSTVSIASARMLASATNAPATICGARSALTPSSSARSVAVILEMKAMSCRKPAAVSVLFTRGPAPEGAAPVSRANDRNVFEVATVRSGAPASSTLAPASAISVASQSRNIATRRRPGGSSGSHSRVSRPAPSGSDSATSGSSSTPLDSSSEPPPMSMLMIRPGLQPYQRRTARKVSRDSSTPLSTLSATPVSARTLARTSSEFLASRTADVAKAISSAQPELPAIFANSSMVSTSLSAPLRVSLPEESIASASRKDALVELIGVGCPPRRASTTSR